MCFDFLYNSFSETSPSNIRIERYNINYMDPHVKYPLLLSDFNESLHCVDRFLEKKITSTKFHENRSRGSRVVACGQTGMTKLMVVLHNFASTTKEWCS